MMTVVNKVGFPYTHTYTTRPCGLALKADEDSVCGFGSELYHDLPFARYTEHGLCFGCMGSETCGHHHLYVPSQSIKCCSGLIVVFSGSP